MCVSRFGWVGAGLLVSEAKDGFEKGDAPPTVVPGHLPESFGDPGIKGVRGMLDSLGASYGDHLFFHGKGDIGRSIVFHDGGERTPVAVVRRDEMEHERTERGFSRECC